MPPKFPLACQMIITDEDLLVKFTGESGARSEFIA